MTKANDKLLMIADSVFSIAESSVIKWTAQPVVS